MGIMRPASLLGMLSTLTTRLPYCTYYTATLLYQYDAYRVAILEKRCAKFCCNIVLIFVIFVVISKRAGRGWWGMGTMRPASLLGTLSTLLPSAPLFLARAN